MPTKTNQRSLDAGTLNQHDLAKFWQLNSDEVIRLLDTSVHGLSSQEALYRKKLYRDSNISSESKFAGIRILLSQLTSPLIAILFVAAIAAWITQNWQDGAIVVSIICISTLIGFAREYQAHTAIKKLKNQLQIRVTALRDNAPTSIAINDVVPGDIVLLRAGSLLPGDGLLLESNRLFVDQAAITGESFPVEKFIETADIDSSKPTTPKNPASYNHCVFFGTSIRSGSATAIIAKIGRGTEFGKITTKLALTPPETDFERSIHQLGKLLLTVMLIIVLTVFFISALFNRATTETLMFVIALAVGLSPELLPAIMTFNLAKGAQQLAKKGLLVRHLNAIQNLGRVDVLCTDKTGTITEGIVKLDHAWDVNFVNSSKVLRMAQLNAFYQSGLPNPLDTAILHDQTFLRPPGYEKLGEIPYDFVRKRISVILKDDSSSHAIMVTKGAVEQILKICCIKTGQTNNDNHDKLEIFRQALQKWSESGFRVLGVAYRTIEIKNKYNTNDEKNLELCGFLTFLDKPKSDAKFAISELNELGISVKIITGDNRFAASFIANSVGIKNAKILTGDELDNLRDEALWHLVESTNIFCEVDPNQKERIVRALRKSQHIVAYLGDGINDTPAMHASDVSISVQSAADVTKSDASLVLMQSDLGILARAVRIGRGTYANTLKYILLTISSNFGNIMSMAVMSLFIPYLPLLSGQILLNNFLSDIPALGLATDYVDEEQIKRPGQLDIRLIWQQMLQFGLVSSFFDFLIFSFLLFFFHENIDIFRTAWFVESLLTEIAIIFSLRTHRLFYKSRPSFFLISSSVFVGGLALLIPYANFADKLGFVPISINLILLILVVVLFYFFATELLKIKVYNQKSST